MCAENAFCMGKQTNKQTKKPHDNPANKLDLFVTLNLRLKQRRQEDR